VKKMAQSSANPNKSFIVLCDGRYVGRVLLY